MKVYQITDAEVIALMETLQLEHHEAAARANVSPDLVGTHEHPCPVNDAFRAYNFVVCRWLQQIGAEKLSRKWG